MINPKISIIVPVYNTGAYLKKCIQSVLRQNYQNYEVLIVDDGSEYKTALMCDELEKVDNRIKVFHKSNKGQLHTRVFGIKQSTGSYVMFLDSDDYLCENAFSIIAEYIGKYECDLLIFGFQKVKNGKIIYTSGFDKDAPLLIKSKRELYLKVFFSSTYNAMWRKVIKRECITKYDYTRFYHLRIAEDLLQSIDFYQHSIKTVFINDILYNYCLNDESVTHLLSYNNIKDRIEVLSEIDCFLKKENVFTKKDYLLYNKKRFEILAFHIFTVASSTLSVKEKKSIYRQMQEDDYVLKHKLQPHLKLGGFSALTIYLFWHSYFDLLVFFCNARNAVISCLKILK